MSVGGTQRSNKFSDDDANYIHNYASQGSWSFGKKVAPQAAKMALDHWGNQSQRPTDVSIKEIFVTFNKLYADNKITKGATANKDDAGLAAAITNKIQKEDINPETLETGAIFLQHCKEASTTLSALENIAPIKLRYLEKNPDIVLTALFSDKDIKELNPEEIAKLFKLAKTEDAKNFIKKALDNKFNSRVCDHVIHLLKSNYGGANVIEFMKDANIGVKDLCEALKDASLGGLRFSRLETLREYLINAQNKPLLIAYLAEEEDMRMGSPSEFLQVLIAGADKECTFEAKVKFFAETSSPTNGKDYYDAYIKNLATLAKDAGTRGFKALEAKVQETQKTISNSLTEEEQTNYNDIFSAYIKEKSNQTNTNALSEALDNINLTPAIKSELIGNILLDLEKESDAQKISLLKEICFKLINHPKSDDSQKNLIYILLDIPLTSPDDRRSFSQYLAHWPNSDKVQMSPKLQKQINEAQLTKVEIQSISEVKSAFSKRPFYQKPVASEAFMKSIVAAKSLTDAAQRELLEYFLKQPYGGTNAFNFITALKITPNNLDEIMKSSTLTDDISKSHMKTLREKLLEGTNLNPFVQYLVGSVTRIDQASPFLKMMIDGVDSQSPLRERIALLAGADISKFSNEEKKNYLMHLSKMVVRAKQADVAIDESTLSKIYDCFYTYRNSFDSEALNNSDLISIILNRAALNYEGDEDLTKTLPWYNKAIEKKVDVKDYLLAQFPGLSQLPSAIVEYNSVDNLKEAMQSTFNKSAKEKINSNTEALKNGTLNISDLFTKEQIRMLSKEHLALLMSTILDRKDGPLNIFGQTAASNIAYLYQNVSKDLKNEFVENLADCTANMNIKDKTKDKTPSHQLYNLKNALEMICQIEHKDYDQFLCEYVLSEKNKKIPVERRYEILEILLFDGYSSKSGLVEHTNGVRPTFLFIKKMIGHNNDLRDWLMGPQQPDITNYTKIPNVYWRLFRS